MKVEDKLNGIKGLLENNEITVESCEAIPLVGKGKYMFRFDLKLRKDIKEAVGLLISHYNNIISLDIKKTNSKFALLLDLKEYYEE